MPISPDYSPPIVLALDQLAPKKTKARSGALGMRDYIRACRQNGKTTTNLTITRLFGEPSGQVDTKAFSATSSLRMYALLEDSPDWLTNRTLQLFSFLVPEQSPWDDEVEAATQDSVDRMGGVLQQLASLDLAPTKVVSSNFGGCATYLSAPTGRKYAIVGAYNDGDFDLTLRNPVSDSEESFDLDNIGVLAGIEMIKDFLDLSQ